MIENIGETLKKINVMDIPELRRPVNEDLKKALRKKLLKKLETNENVPPEVRAKAMRRLSFGPEEYRENDTDQEIED